MQALQPKRFIKANEKAQKYQCAICNYITEKPYVCGGKCQKMFCFQCLNCIRRNKNQCPFKCSKPWDVIQCKEIQLQFVCPFETQKCQNSINCLSQFYSHGQVCKFLPQNWKEREQNFKRYRCEKGHDLYFLDEQDLRKLYGWDFYSQPTNSTCSSCSTKGLCRSICPNCSLKDKFVLYCTSCRKPPCTKQTCLYSHKFTKQRVFSSSLICDFCGTAANLLGPFAFRDVRCNFDICQVCYINLPETHELVPFKMAKNSIAHLCQKQESDSSDEQEERRSLFRRLLQIRNHEEPPQALQYIPQPMQQDLSSQLQVLQRMQDDNSSSSNQSNEEQEHQNQQNL